MKLQNAAAAAFLLLATASTALATTYVPMSDANLADQAAAVARVKVIAVEPGPANRTPATDYLVEVDELVQGYLPGSTVVVRVPGGVRMDGVGLKIWGAPEFQPGEEALLFLQPEADGTYGVLHLMLGAFHARRSGAAKLAVQDLAEAHALSGSGEGNGVRDLDLFAAWLADRAAGITRIPDYWLEGPEAGDDPLGKAHSLMRAADNVPPRWFTFDAGKSVAWSVHSAGQPGLDLNQTIEAFQAALAAWTDDPMSSIRYHYTGTTSASGGLGTSDKVNAILFDDPKGQVSGTFNCPAGGVVALGGSYFSASTRSYRSQSYHEILEADVVTNDGAECFFRNNPQGAAEVFAHELGHTLGFGHSDDSQALMWSKAHNDGRGARLENDERMAASVVYGDGSYQPAPPTPPSGVEEIVLTGSALSKEIQLSWNSTFAGIEGFRVESKQGKNFKPLLTVPGSDKSATVSGLKPNKVYTLRVTALDAGGKDAGCSNIVRIRTSKK